MKPHTGQNHSPAKLLLVLLLPLPALNGAPIDATQLPPAATKKIDFAADIRPILGKDCLRCHGPERPKSNFRLTNRDLALKGGENGVDILPGKSAESPLIHYVARLVPDMEMPPEGKGTPLSTNEIGLLRAWIDQGAAWDNSAALAQANSSFDLSPLLGWTTVHGDRAQFRDLEWQPEGWNGGAEEFAAEQRLPDGRLVAVNGHVLRDDYKLTLDLRKPDLGFVRVNFAQFRRYYGDSGGYVTGFDPALYRLGQDLHVDTGRAGIEVGLTLPELPRIVLGYEYQYKEGAKSMLTWGPVQSPTGSFLDVRNAYPASKEIDEHTHVLRLDIAYETHGFELENNLRGEFYASDTLRTDALNVPAGASAPNLFTLVREQHRYDQVADTVRVQKTLADWWLAGVGYRYSWLDGDGSFRLTPVENTGQASAGSAWFANKIVLDEAWQVANFNSQFLPLPQFTATLGLQGEWKRQDTFGDVNLDEVVDPADPTAGIFRFPATEQSALDQTTAEEMVLVRYTGLPFTSLYAEAALKQEDYARTADQYGGPHAVQFASDAVARWAEYRLGFNSSPWRRVSFGGQYRHRDRQTDYTYPIAISGGEAYPGFIQARDVLSDEVEARATVQVATWVKATLTYHWGDSEFRTTTGATSLADVGPSATPGGMVVAGHYQAHTISANATVTPLRRLSCSGTVSYQNSRTTTFDNGSESVAPYAGDLWSLFANASYALDEATDVFAGYTFSLARYGQHNAAAGLPLGLDYDRHGVQAGIARHLTRSATAKLQYAYFSYNEPSNAQLRDYTAHQVLAVMALRW